MVTITFINKVPSTSSFAINLIKKKISKEGIVFAEHQTHGRGRYGNKWISKKGNMFCSIYKQVKSQKDILSAQFTSLRIVKNYLLQASVNRKLIEIKEPNDILIDKQKVCGILVESIKFKNKIFLIVGVGLNLVKAPKIKNYKTTYLNKYISRKITKLDFIKYLEKKIKNF